MIWAETEAGPIVHGGGDCSPGLMARSVEEAGQAGSGLGRLGGEAGRGLADVGLEIGTRPTGASRREVNAGAVSGDAGRGGGWSSCSGDAAVQGTEEGADPGAVTEDSERERVV